MKLRSLCTSATAYALTAFAPASGADLSTVPTYFIFKGNPVPVKYLAGKLIRLPVQDADDLAELTKLEAVSALASAPRLNILSPSVQSKILYVSAPQVPAYGTSMFEISDQDSNERSAKQTMLAWSGPSSFHEITLNKSSHDALPKQLLIVQSRRQLTPLLDFRDADRIRRQLKLEGPIRIRDYGRTSVAPDLAFADITWRIKDLPDALANNGIDSWSPYMRVEYILNTRTNRIVYRNVTNIAGVEEQDMRLFKESGGPLLMAVSINCSDGSEPLILDIENESYGTDHKDDVPPSPHCFPAQ